MFEAPPLTLHGPPGNARLFSSDTSRQPRILLWGRAGRSDRGGGARRVSRGGLGRCECVGGRAGRGHTASSEPSANSPGAAGHAHHGRGPPQGPASAHPGLRGPCAPARLAGAPAEGARGGPGKRWGPGGRRDCWVGPGPPPPAPCPTLPPTGSSRPGGESSRRRLCSQPAGRTAPTCRVGERGAPPPRTLVFSSPSETTRLATRVSDTRRCDARTGRQARGW